MKEGREAREGGRGGIERQQEEEEEEEVVVKSGSYRKIKDKNVRCDVVLWRGGEGKDVTWKYL